MYLVLNPHDRRTHRPGGRQRTERGKSSHTGRVWTELEAIDDDLRLIAIRSLPMNRIWAVPLLPARALADTGDNILSKSTLQGGVITATLPPWRHAMALASNVAASGTLTPGCKTRNP